MKSYPDEKTKKDTLDYLEACILQSVNDLKRPCLSSDQKSKFYKRVDDACRVYFEATKVPVIEKNKVEVGHLDDLPTDFNRVFVKVGGMVLYEGNGKIKQAELVRQVLVDPRDPATSPFDFDSGTRGIWHISIELEVK